MVPPISYCQYFGRAQATQIPSKTLNRDQNKNNKHNNYSTDEDGNDHNNGSVAKAIIMFMQDSMLSCITTHRPYYGKSSQEPWTSHDAQTAMLRGEGHLQ